VDAYFNGSGSLGLIDPMIRRLRDEPGRRRTRDVEAPAVKVLAGTVAIGLSPVRLAPRERELLFYLALAQRPCSRAELVEAIWPKSAERSPSVLRVYVSRIRTRMRDPDIITLLESGDYQIAPYVRVDLDDIEEMLRIATRQHALTGELRERLSGHVRTYGYEVPASMSAWEWFAPFAGRALELSRRAALLLAGDAIERGAPSEARELADRLITLDAFDEAAWETMIRASLAAGDVMSARRSYRKFAELLANELGSDPSPKLRELVTRL
ncbi:MAG: winged helix-turn-helix domain-containing protein, partial [Candidatus Aquilonibacter sp.]